jgi:hypothetical protein
MAQLPHYIPGTPSPKATLAIVERVCDLLATHVPTEDLHRAAVTYVTQVDQVVAADDEMAGYVRELERRADEAAASSSDLRSFGDLPSGDALAAQFEQFLREQDDSS